MKGYSLAVAFNAIFLVIFLLLLLSYSNNVESTRTLKDQSSSPAFIGLIINRAYSGPSHKGAVDTFISEK
ncbi:hypothetical protein GmHk_20G058255 [Glycine max]|nr:hypothetical protein GmHk_20G058255 [Glycine max]